MEGHTNWGSVDPYWCGHQLTLEGALSKWLCQFYDIWGQRGGSLGVEKNWDLSNSGEKYIQSFLHYKGEVIYIYMRYMICIIYNIIFDIIYPIFNIQDKNNGILPSHEKNEIFPFVTTWMDIEGIMLSEKSQTEKDKYCMILLIWGI